MGRIIGFDPGLASTGWGVIDSVKGRLRHIGHGTIVTRSDMPRSERLKIIFTEIQSLLGEFKPVSGGIESLFFSKNISSALPVAEGRGVILLACSLNGLPIYEFTPVQIKQGVVGNGRADKKQVQSMVQLILGMEDWKSSTHDADALAAAICRAHTEGEHV